MKIQLLSDLHLEVHPKLQIAPAPDADLLILAGDIGSYQRGSQLEDNDFGLRRFSPRHGWPVPVLFLPGNHEYDMLDFDETHDRLRRLCQELGMIWLERETQVLQGVRFVGTTLWSDFDALAGGHAAAAKASLSEVLQGREKAFRAANFYLRKAGTTRHGQPMLAPQVREQALLCQDWLEQALQQDFDGPTVAVTHFAPSLLSADRRYGLTPGTAGFCNSLDHLLPHAQYWLHGHLHAPSRYQCAGCQVRANPLGYARKNEQDFFDPAFCIEVVNDQPASN